MALEMKEACETCARSLAPDGVAYVCSFECTFCAECTADTHNAICPNCGGELVLRPRRPTG